MNHNRTDKRPHTPTVDIFGRSDQLAAEVAVCSTNNKNEKTVPFNGTRNQDLSNRAVADLHVKPASRWDWFEMACCCKIGREVEVPSSCQFCFPSLLSCIPPQSCNHLHTNVYTNSR